MVKGWFHETLPEFLSQHPLLDLAFVHIDGDTYEAATAVLRELQPLIRPGLYILFDEYQGYPSWRSGEFAAWQEFCQQHKICYEYLAFSDMQALIQVVEPSA